MGRFLTRRWNTFLDALYVVPLGNAKRLQDVGKTRVVELDWWQSHREGSLEITLVPAR